MVAIQVGAEESKDLKQIYFPFTNRKITGEG